MAGALHPVVLRDGRVMFSSLESQGVRGESLKWTFDSAMFGKLQGRFAVVGSSILAAYGCEASGYYGSEHLGQLDRNNYRSVGMLLLKDKLVYSWQTLHKREADGAVSRVLIELLAAALALLFQGFEGRRDSG